MSEARETEFVRHDFDGAGWWCSIHNSADCAVPTETVHFLPYGSYVASCGRIEDQRHPARWSDLRRDTTCGECQAQMTNYGDLPPVATNPPASSALGGDDE